MDLNQKFKETKDRVVEGARKLGHNINNTAKSFVIWALDNPAEATAIVVPVSIAAIRSSQSLIVSHRLNKQQRIADSRIYDRKLGASWHLKRPLTNNELAYIDSMKKQGVSLHDSLEHLKVI